MKNYELTVVLPGKLTAAKKKGALEKIEKMISTFKGKIVKSEDWGERELAYSIAKNDSGTYLYFEVELEAAQAKALNDKIRLEEDLIRYLFVKGENNQSGKKFK